MTPNAIKNDLRAGKTIAGAMIFEFFSPGMASILSNAGCKFVLYDMEHTGLGYETLKEINPRLIYCAVSGFGQVGPQAKTAAFDGMIQAMSGLMSITGFPSNAGLRGRSVGESTHEATRERVPGRPRRIGLRGARFDRRV